MLDLTAQTGGTTMEPDSQGSRRLVSVFWAVWQHPWRISLQMLAAYCVAIPRISRHCLTSLEAGSIAGWAWIRCFLLLNLLVRDCYL